MYYPEEQMHNIYINIILYIVINPTCFSAPASSSGSLIIVLCCVYQIYLNYYNYNPIKTVD